MNGNNGNNLNMSNNQVQDYINNGRINLNAAGNQGRYTRSTHFQTLEEWDSIFNHLSVYSAGVHATADLLQGMLLRRPDHHRRNYAYDSFPIITWIPLPCSIPNFSRCILHVEEVNPQTNTLSGSSFIPVEITHHDNHPITQAITRMFHVYSPYPASYQTNESLVFETARENEAIRQMCACLTQGGNNFAEYDAQQDANRNEQHADLNTASRHILYDPETLARANTRVNELMLAHAQQAQQGRGVHEMTINESRQVHRAWRDVVFPETTAQERRYAYARYAADQIMTHRYIRIRMAHDNPHEPNPIVLPFHNDYNNNDNHRENNPVDRARQEQAPENVYIQDLYDGQNNDERARIAAEDVRLRENEIPIHHLPLNEV
jgi:hypothetical protein